MIMNSIELKNINEVFCAYRYLMSDSNIFESNKRQLSKLALLIDANALAVILNFFNEYPETNTNRWRSNLLTIRMFALFTYEIVAYLESLGNTIDELLDDKEVFSEITKIRSKVHQFKPKSFSKNIDHIDKTMGRSRDRLYPHIDICFEYTEINNEPFLIGTNVNQFHFDEAKKQATVNLMQRVIRTIERAFWDSYDFKIKPNDITRKTEWIRYCYTDIVKFSKVKNERLIDRLIAAYDDLACIIDFFSITILTEEYLKESPFLLYFFSKMIAIVLDETYDNINNYIKYAKDSEEKNLIKTLLSCNEKFSLNTYKALRNNLHYMEQNLVNIGTPTEQYEFLKKQILEVFNLLNKIKSILNLNPSRRKILLYKFIAWTQS